MGVVDYLTVREQSSSSSEQALPVMHHIAIAKDSHGHSSLMQHTHIPPALGGDTEDGACSSPSSSSTSLSILSFNIWHTMTPATHAADNTPKFEMYMKRLQHLAEVIVRSGADVVGLQVSQSVRQTFWSLPMHAFDPQLITPRYKSNQSFLLTHTSTGGPLR